MERKARRWITLLLLPAALYGALVLWATVDATGFSLLFCEHPAADSAYGDPGVRFDGIECRWGVTADQEILSDPDAPEAATVLRRPAFPTFRWVVVLSTLAAVVVAVSRRGRREPDRYG